MSTGTLRIRLGRQNDLPQVKTFTANTFSWGDYLPGIWNRWVKSAGDLMVAEIDKRVVGTLNVRYQGNHEAWLEGVRVDGDFRGQGVASLLVQNGLEYAKRRKCRVSLLETGLRNLAGQRTFEKFGFHYITHYDTYKVAPCAGTLDGVRFAKMADLKVCWDIWLSSSTRRITRTIVPSPYGWRWWEQTRTRMRDEIRAGRLWVAQDAFMMLHPEDDGGLDVKLVVGRKRGVVKLLNAARAIAAQNGNEQVFWIAPHNPKVKELAAATNFILDDDDLLIYARPL